MANDLLTESGWKTTAQKFKVKDNGLQKALAAYENLDAKKYDERLKALDSINKLATDLKKVKEVATLPEVVKYLTSVAAAAVAEKTQITKAKASATKAAAGASKLPPLQPGDAVVVGGKSYLIFADEVREGGTCAWRGRNPGNIRWGEKYGAIKGKQHKCGSSGKFAVFPDETTGLAAIVKVLKGYGHISVKDAMAKYAPASDGNDPDAYAQSVAKKMGVTVETFVDALDSSQLDKFAEGVKTFEGWKAGTAYKRDDSKLPEEIRQRL